MRKTCANCNNEYNLDHFNKHSGTVDKLRTYCRDCGAKKKKLKREMNPKSFSVSVEKKECRTCKITKPSNRFTKDRHNPDGLCTQCKDCRSNNTKKYYLIKKEAIKQNTRQYYQKNKDTIRIKRRVYRKNREKTDIFYKLKRRLRNRLYYALKKTSWKKDTHFSQYIGCSLEELKKHIETQFKSGMNWDNHGLVWDLDHYIPLSSAKTEKQIYDLSHYTNLRPEFKEYNRNVKRDKLPSNICWQKLQRDRLLQEDIKNGCPTDVKASEFVLAYEKITEEHRKFIERYEWLGTCGFGVRYVFTARFNGLLGGVVMVAEPNGYQFDKKLEALIQRGACASWTPKNLGSRLVMFACRWMKDNTSKRIFVAYSDPEAGEIGTIYQACNFDYLGQTFGADCYYELSDGNFVTQRYFTRTSSMKKWAKALNIEWQKEWSKENGFQNRNNIPEHIKRQLDEYARKQYEHLPKVKKTPKGKYVLLLTNKREKIEKTWKPLPYPKRIIETSITAA
jgi:hypothetical protein